MVEGESLLQRKPDRAARSSVGVGEEREFFLFRASVTRGGCGLNLRTEGFRSGWFRFGSCLDASRLKVQVGCKVSCVFGGRKGRLYGWSMKSYNVSVAAQVGSCRLLFPCGADFGFSGGELYTT